MRRLPGIALASLLLAATATSFAEPLQIYYFPRPPLYEKNADGSAGGFITEIARLILDEAKLSYRFVELPSMRVEQAIVNGDYAAGLGWFKTGEREKWANFSAPIYRDLPLVAIVNKAKAAAVGSRTTIDRLLGSGLTLGTIRGFSYGSFADKAIERNKPRKETIAGEQSALIKMVSRGRADLLLLGLEEASYLMANDVDSAASLEIVRITDAPAGNLRYFMFSKTVEKSVIERIDAAIARVMEGPAYQRLVDFSRYLRD